MSGKVKLTKRTKKNDHYIYVFMTLTSVWVYQVRATYTGVDTPLRYYVLSRSIIKAEKNTLPPEHFINNSYASLGAFVRKAKKEIEANES